MTTNEIKEALEEINGCGFDKELTLDFIVNLTKANGKEWIRNHLRDRNSMDMDLANRTL